MLSIRWKSENIIKDYIDGNYTVHLPQSNEGNIYQLLASVDQLATMLQAENDTDQFVDCVIENVGDAIIGFFKIDAACIHSCDFQH